MSSNPDFTPVCIFCLGNIDSRNEENEGGLFRQFTNFCRSYLKVENVDKLLCLMDSGQVLKDALFCGECKGVLENILDLHRAFENLKGKLLRQVISLEGIIQKSGKDARSNRKFVPIRKLKLLATQLNAGQHYLQVELFRKQVAKQCGLKASTILPSLVLKRSDGVNSGDLTAGKPVGSNDVNTTGFTAVGVEPFTVPTRKTTNDFISFIIIFSFAYGWSLERILDNCQSNHTQRLLLPDVTSDNKIFQTNPKGSKKSKSRRGGVSKKRKKSVTTHSPAVSRKRGLGGRAKLINARSSNIKEELTFDSNTPKFPSLKFEVGLPTIRKAGETATSEAMTVENDTVADKIEIDIPSPAPSMMADDFDDSTFDEPADEDKQEEVVDKPMKTENRRLRPRSESQLAKMVEIETEKNKKRKSRKPQQQRHTSTPSAPFIKRRKRRSKKEAATDPVKRIIVKNDLYSAAFGFSLKCTHCRTRFVTLSSFHDHVRKTHGERLESNYNCSMCQKEFDTTSRYLYHLQAHHEKDDDKPLFCVYCPESFTTVEMSEFHRKNHHWIHPQELHCDLDTCPEKFISTQELQDHQKSHLSAPSSETSDSSNNGHQLFTCEKCNLSFLKPDRLHLHKFNHTEKDSDDHYPCNIDNCSERFQTMFSLATHYNTDHGSKLKLLYCRDSTCPFYFFNDKQSNAHKETHLLYGKKLQPQVRATVNKMRSTRCLYCRKEFSIRLERDTHEDNCPEGPSLEHKQKSNKKYACGKCEHSVNHRSAMIKHQQSIHMDALFPCPHCERTFHRQDHMNIHINRIHSKAKQFVCDICGRVCPNTCELRYHLKEHEHLHLCPICGKRCSRGWLLKMHMRSHTGERMQCQWCPRLFRTVGLIKIHVQEAHPEEFQKNYNGVVKRRIKYRLVKKQDVIKNPEDYRKMYSLAPREDGSDNLQSSQQNQEYVKPETTTDNFADNFNALIWNNHNASSSGVSSSGQKTEYEQI